MALRLLRLRKSISFIQHSAKYHDYVRFATPGGVIRIPLNSPKVIGVANSRGDRSHQEDFYAYATLSLDPEELKLSLKKALGVDWDPSKVGDAFSRQVTFIGIYDGHGGSAVSQYLRQELHGIFESVNKAAIPELLAWAKELGGYFRRFNGGALAPWKSSIDDTPALDLEARATEAFFEASQPFRCMYTCPTVPQVDRNLSTDPVSQSCGATASVALLHSLDAPATPFFAAEKLAVTIAHCGDTRVLLCSVNDGRVVPMTETHHADAHVESIRLRRMMGASLITDSFGESRWMGALANTRCLGDLRYKKFGVTPEPQVQTKLLNGKDWAYMILVSDGVSSVLSDAEVVDLARGAQDPKAAAESILAFAQELGGEDNATALVVPLAGWGTIEGPDSTKDLREYRRQQADQRLSMADSLQARLQLASAEFQKIQGELSNAVEARQRLDAQLSENELVKKVEFALLTPENRVFKQVGSVLVKQDQAEAKGNIETRLKFIRSEIKRVETQLKDIEGRQEKKKSEIVEIQTALQQLQAQQTAPAPTPNALPA
ncbi:hypothetical protein DXG01_011827 [Tephrocybe rancida]|nr:hypothetical protein DXG01_011827 [Tephrocybe rancida]